MDKLSVYNILSLICEIERLESRKKLGTRSLLNRHVTKLREEYSDGGCEIKVENDKINSFNWFNKLPEAIKHKIFCLLDHYSLIQFSQAFPNYINSIINPIYWKKINLLRSRRMLKLNEMRVLSKHLGNHMKYVDLQLECLDEATIYNILEEQVNETKCLNELILECNNSSTRIVELITTQLFNLRILNLNFDNLNDTHLTHIASSLVNLKSVFVASKIDVSLGLKYLLEEISCLEEFSFNLPSVNELIHDVVYNRHGKTIKRLQFETFEVAQNDRVLQKLKTLNNLKHLHLSNFMYSRTVTELFDELDKIESLSINFCGISQSFNTYVLPRRCELGLKRVEISNVSLSIIDFNLIFLSACIEELLFKNVYISDLEFLDYCGHFPRLKYMYVEQSSYADYGLTFDFLNEILKYSTAVCFRRLEYLFVSTKTTKNDEVTLIKSKFEKIREQKRFKIGLVINDVAVIEN